LFIVPEEVLPTKVSSAVGASREAFEAAKVNWGSESQEELEEELKELEEEVSMEDIVEAESQESGVEVEAEDEAGEELTTSQDVECSSEGKKLVGDPTFWTIKGSRSFYYFVIFLVFPIPDALLLTEQHLNRPRTSTL
jgi:hypothetical protein